MSIDCGSALFRGESVAGEIAVHIARPVGLAVAVGVVVQVGVALAGRVGGLPRGLLQSPRQQQPQLHPAAVVPERGVLFDPFAAGILADAVGPELALGSFSIALIGFSLFAIIFFKQIRKLD